MLVKIVLVLKRDQLSIYIFSIHLNNILEKMSQQIELKNQNSIENEDLEHLNALQRMTSVEEREDRRKMRDVFDSVGYFRK